MCVPHEVAFAFKIYSWSVFSLVNITLCFWVSFCRVAIWNHIFSDLVHFHLL